MKKFECRKDDLVVFKLGGENKTVCITDEPYETIAQDIAVYRKPERLFSFCHDLWLGWNTINTTQPFATYLYNRLSSDEFCIYERVWQQSKQQSITIKEGEIVKTEDGIKFKLVRVEE